MAAPVNSSGVADVATSAKPVGKPEQVAIVGADVATSAPNSLPENKTTSTIGTMTDTRSGMPLAPGVATPAADNGNNSGLGIINYTDPRKL